MSFYVGRIFEDQLPIVGVVNEGFQKYLQPGDRIISINGKQVMIWGHLSRYTNQDAGDEIVFEREGVVETIATTSIEPVSWYSEILPSVPATIGSVAPGMPAYRSGLMEGDTIASVAGEDVNNWHEMREAIVKYPGEEVELVINRGEAQLTVTVPLETNLLDEEGHKMIGITQYMGEKYFERYGLINSLKYGFYSSTSFIVMNYQALFKIITKPFLAKDILADR